MQELFDWGVIGSIGSAVGSFVALIGILVAVWQTFKQHRNERAAQIRADIRNFEDAARDFISVLEDVFTNHTVRSAWTAREIIRKRLPPDPGYNDLSEILKDETIGFLIGVESWEQNLGSVIFPAKQELLTSSRRLSGCLKILSPTVRILVAISEDVKKAYIHQLTQPKQVRLFLNKNRHENDVLMLLTGLEKHLYENTLKHFKLRYVNSKATWMLDKLIGEIVTTISKLDTSTLLKTAHAGVVVRSNSHTDEMHRYLSCLNRGIPSDSLQQISDLINELEKTLSKDGAKQAIDDPGILC